MEKLSLKRLENVDLKKVVINDSFWSKRQKLIKETVIPYQWAALNDAIPGAEPSHTIENFRIAAGESNEEYYGMVFQDSDLAKWLETVGHSLAIERDDELERIADKAIDLIGRAQLSDGYLNTYFTVAHPDKKWTNLRDDHELYCAGHLIEAAVAYYEATGKQKIIDIVCKLVDHIDSVLGPETGKKRGYPGHPEIELALMKLYKVTGNKQHLNLCKFFIEERGAQPPHYYDIEAKLREEKHKNKKDLFHSKDYSQAHLPVREQKTAEGHSVRALYLYSGMVDLATELQDESLIEACRQLWKNVTRQRMYITGGIGSSQYRESFTVDYDLPNDRAYTETCASIALVFWADRMLQIEEDSEYADVIERALYNGILSGMSLDGKSYFYVNPLEVWPSTVDHRNDMESVQYKRQSWFGCACCPPNLSRLVASLGRYIYSHHDSNKEIFIHQYIGGNTTVELDGNNVGITQKTEYPWDEKINVQIEIEHEMEFTVALRLPSWCKNPRIKVNDEIIDVSSISKKGYAKITRKWKNDDRIELVLPMPVEMVRANPNVRENIGKVALQRGPIVYCIEEADNGENLKSISLATNSALSVAYEKDLLEGVTVITGEGLRIKEIESDQLYFTGEIEMVRSEVKAIPYFSWSNRKPGEMSVWIREE
ncbi:glycoside hydrolase family 127 protein [Lederbergia lenta]|uniref:Acetyl-CoA carboxylase, biotin carboxylase n=1 Tax=Lederbergia lenta TaxID=1467 RepID=A0A2X4WUM1_LEDLE|nr:beta-L-arabinofuranosidase domain-containing protein [Lederbergia lenta]MEC2322994.1 glycoside hydrolase family 127 protein [Lederbergia lenta]SQI62172.1 acetyl-CoA carboxylase, biotin carboxylase [Lederbergia lenta]